MNSRGIAICYSNNTIRNGLNGRGTWEHGLHCPPYLDLTASGTYVADDYLEAQQNISSNAIVPGGLRVNYRAGNEVHLTPGFHASAGSRVHAFIHPCDQSGNSFKPKQLILPVRATDEEEMEQSAAELSVYPNPNDGSFTVFLDTSQDPLCPDRWVTVVDATGRELLSRTFRGNMTNMVVHGFHGLALVIVRNCGTLHSRKVLIE